jgi:catechol 2,3-dioxygenase-like lactoylglutathione lyase family enzyme
VPRRPRATPRLFRILVAATDLGRSTRFYERLLGTPGRVVAPGRVYFDCGSVIVGVLDRSDAPAAERTVPTEAIYFATSDLAGVYARARRLRCLSPELIHGDPASPAGRTAVRPWGERSFYATDPSGNPLCFVDDRTLFTGSARQIAALARASR